MNKKILGRLSFWTLIPVIIWNIVFYSKLPDAYQEGKGWEQVPAILEYLEMGLRIVSFACLAFLTLEIKSKSQKLGLVLYLGGIVIYFISWSLQMLEPESLWSTSAIGFSAPAFTALIWLIGIGLMNKPIQEKTNFLPGIYLVSAVLFSLVHTFHALIVYFGLR